MHTCLHAEGGSKQPGIARHMKARVLLCVSHSLAFTHAVRTLTYHPAHPCCSCSHSPHLNTISCSPCCSCLQFAAACSRCSKLIVKQIALGDAEFFAALCDSKSLTHVVLHCVGLTSHVAEASLGRLAAGGCPGAHELIQIVASGRQGCVLCVFLAQWRWHLGCLCHGHLLAERRTACRQLGRYRCVGLAASFTHIHVYLHALGLNMLQAGA